MDPETLAQAFDLPAPPEDTEESDDDAIEADEGDLDADVAMALDASAEPEDRREAFIRAVKAALKG